VQSCSPCAHAQRGSPAALVPGSAWAVNSKRCIGAWGPCEGAARCALPPGRPGPVPQGRYRHHCWRCGILHGNAAFSFTHTTCVYARSMPRSWSLHQMAGRQHLVCATRLICACCCADPCAACNGPRDRIPRRADPRPSCQVHRNHPEPRQRPSGAHGVAGPEGELTPSCTAQHRSVP
jgi:hypothetical protein